ncbi:MAG TPA: hypothetical protein VLT33_07000, partial [Labilithrix sp.]|nr:hypothetical protein [Labilithrix sp.]
SDRERHPRIGTARTESTYGDLLGAMIGEGGGLGVLAAYHAAELGLHDPARGSATRTATAKTAFAELSTRDVSVGPAEAETGA